MKSIFQKFGLGILAGLFLLFSAGMAGQGASAQDFLQNYASPLPEMKDPMSEAEFNQKTIPHEGVAAGDEALTYSFRLPPDWKGSMDVAVGNYQVSSKVLGEVLRFYGPPVIDSRSHFSLQALTLDYEMTAYQWLLQFLLSNGYAIQGISEIDPNRAEALYVRVEDSFTYVIRTVAIASGKRIIMAEYSLPADNWEQEKKMQAQVMKTFKLANIVKEPIEELKKYHFFDISEFQYPSSWEMRTSPQVSVDRMKFELRNVLSAVQPDETIIRRLNGRIQVEALSYDVVKSVAQEAERLKEDVRQSSGLIVGDKIETLTDVKFDKAVKPVVVEVYNASDGKNKILKYEYWVTMIEVGDYFYFITLVTPSRDEEYFVWARNSETYKLILQLFRPVAEE